MSHIVCLKVGYETRNLAKRALKEIGQKSHQRKKKPIRTYECPFCSQWHLTSRPMREF